jgi:hypothetical protein
MRKPCPYPHWREAPGILLAVHRDSMKFACVQMGNCTCLWPARTPHVRNTVTSVTESLPLPQNLPCSGLWWSWVSTLCGSWTSCKTEKGGCKTCISKDLRKEDVPAPVFGQQWNVDVRQNIEEMSREWVYSTGVADFHHNNSTEFSLPSLPLHLSYKSMFKESLNCCVELTYDL